MLKLLLGETKHLITIIFLIGISPNYFMAFLSYIYGVRASYRFNCRDSGFFDFMDRYDEVMADRRIHIKEELMLKYHALSVPPGARIKSQVTNLILFRIK